MRTLRSFGPSMATLAATMVALQPNAPAAAIDVHDTRLLEQPALSANHLAFVYANDLWISGRDGSNVRRLTSHESHVNEPRFSPDGKIIAFTAEFDGNADVYVMSIEGGAPRRLTFHPDQDLVQGFSPDGRNILFASSRSVFTRRHQRFFTIPVDPGPSASFFPTELPIPHGLRGTYSPDGKKIAYIPIQERFDQWKNYRGGTTSRIWIYDVADHSVVQVPQPEGRCNDTDPAWIGDTVYFRSDRNGEFNLFSFREGSGDVTAHTDFQDWPIEHVTSSGKDLVFEQSGYLHLWTPGAGGSGQAKPRRVAIGVVDDLDETRVRWVEGPEWIRSAAISPGGERAVFEYRGEIVTLPAKKGSQRNLTLSTGVNERSPAWSPDGKSIAYFSDQGGEYRLHIRNQDGGGEAKISEVKGSGFYENLSWSPDAEHLSFIDNSWSLYVFTPKTSKLTKIAQDPFFGPSEVRALEHDWSPDSRWLAYTNNSGANIATVWFFDTKTGERHQITDGLSEASRPVFDTTGKYLFFLASTDAGPAKSWFAMSNADMEVTSSVYVAVLAAGTESPLAPESDEVGGDDEKAKNADEDSDDEDGMSIQSETGKASKKSKSSSGKKGDAEIADKTKKVAPMVIDFDGLGQRILALPVASGTYADLQTGKAGQVFYRRITDAGPSLWRFDFEDREETEILPKASGFVLSHDRQKLLFNSDGAWGIASAVGGPIKAGEDRLAVDKLTVRVDPRAEWQQIFREVWRIQRDFFYAPNMHGADWDAMGEKYSALLGDVATRGDLNRVLRWMSSELAVGHHRVGGGDERLEAKSIPGGLLGADYEVAGDRYRFKKVFGGLNWNPDLRAPLTEPGVSVKAGEYLLAVRGRDLTAGQNLYSLFENTAGEVIEITVGPNADGRGSRTVNVVPVESEASLRNRDWVEGNLEKVHDATNGRVAYVYVPNTTTLGHTYFKRYFFPQVDKEAIIIDERFNGGGQVADYYIDHLRRPTISYWATRYGRDIRTPSASIPGPKVMIIDETAGSGGDLLPWMFHNLGIGKLVGKRTWGGLVGILGFPVLLDGGFVTAPNLAIWTEDGFVVENVGVPPDIEVEQWPADVIAGRDPQLERAIAVALEELEANPVVVPKRPEYPVRVRKP